MDRLAMIRALAIGGTALSLGAAARLVVYPVVGLPAPVRRAEARPDAAWGPPHPVNDDSLALLISGRNPFRVDRAPAEVPFDPDVSAGMAVSPPPARPPRPTLVLVGLVLGSEPAALIDGFPGVDGTRVLRVGERWDDYHVRAIAADRVVIVAPDTTWTLRLRSQFP